MGLSPQIRENHEGSHLGRRVGDTAQRGDRGEAQADDRDRRAADTLAYHEMLLVSWHQSVCHLPGLQRLFHKGIFFELFSSEYLTVYMICIYFLSVGFFYFRFLILILYIFRRY